MSKCLSHNGCKQSFQEVNVRVSFDLTTSTCTLQLPKAQGGILFVFWSNSQGCLIYNKQRNAANREVGNRRIFCLFHLVVDN